MSAADAAAFLRLYPNQQSAGSPYGTGDVKFLWKLFKRSSSMFGDLAFEAPRRLFLRAANLLDTANQAAATNGTLVESIVTVTQTIVEDQAVNTTIVAANETSVAVGSNSTVTTTSTTVIEGSFSGNITNTTIMLAPFEYVPLKVWSYQFSQRSTGGFDYLGGASGLSRPRSLSLTLSCALADVECLLQRLMATRSPGSGRQARRPRSAPTTFATR